jgi:hypothetical protein
MPRAMYVLFGHFAAIAALWVTIAAASAQSTELIMFEAPGCPWCKRWHAEVGPGYPKSDEGQRAPLRVLPIEKVSEAGATLSKPISASPTFVLIDRGKEVGRIVGYPGADFFWPLLAELLAKMDRVPHTDLGPKRNAPTQVAGPRARIASLTQISVSYCKT